MPTHLAVAEQLQLPGLHAGVCGLHVLLHYAAIGALLRCVAGSHKVETACSVALLLTLLGADERSLQDNMLPPKKNVRRAAAQGR